MGHFSRGAICLAILSALACGLAAGDPIHDAAASGDLEKVKALLNSNSGLVFSKDSSGMTPLHFAAQNGHKEVAEVLLANKAEAGSNDRDGVMPLHLAAYTGHRDVVELLLA